MLVDADGHDAHHVVMDAHQTLHFGDGGGGAVRLQESVVALAVLVDLVGHRTKTPVFVTDDVAAVVFQNLREMLDQTFGLRVGDILTRNKDVLVESHVVSSIFQRASKCGAQGFHPHTRGVAIHVFGSARLIRVKEKRRKRQSKTSATRAKLSLFCASQRRLRTRRKR